MTAPTVDVTVGDLAEQMRACFADALGRDVCLRGGATADLWLSNNEDECCTGAAWVRVVTFYPGFPSPDPSPDNCWPALWAVVLELGAARCAMTPDENTIPTCEEHTALAVDLHDDAAAMLCAAWCFTAAEDESGEGRQYAIGPWLPAPTQGRCAGGSLQVTVAFAPCLQCPDPVS